MISNRPVFHQNLSLSSYVRFEERRGSWTTEKDDDTDQRRRGETKRDPSRSIGHVPRRYPILRYAKTAGLVLYNVTSRSVFDLRRLGRLVAFRRIDEDSLQRKWSGLFADSGMCEWSILGPKSSAVNFGRYRRFHARTLYLAILHRFALFSAFHGGVRVQELLSTITASTVGNVGRTTARIRHSLLARMHHSSGWEFLAAFVEFRFVDGESR